MEWSAAEPGQLAVKRCCVKLRHSKKDFRRLYWNRWQLGFGVHEKLWPGQRKVQVSLFNSGLRGTEWTMHFWCSCGDLKHWTCPCPLPALLISSVLPGIWKCAVNKTSENYCPKPNMEQSVPWWHNFVQYWVEQNSTWFLTTGFLSDFEVLMYVMTPAEQG